MTERTAGLDHGLTDYGDRDFSRYLRRSFAQSMGYSPIPGRISTIATATFPNC